MHAGFHALVKLTTRCGFLSPPRSSATMRKKTSGSTRPAFFSFSRSTLRLQKRPQFRGHGEHAALAVLGCASVQAHFAGGKIYTVPFQRQDF